MAEVRKYKVPPYGAGEASEMCFPEGARFLHVGAQSDNWEFSTHSVYIWALVDPFRASGPARRIWFFSTGQLIPTGARYIGTAVIESNGLVWHVFEEANHG